MNQIVIPDEVEDFNEVLIKHGIQRVLNSRNLSVFASLLFKK